jgi:2-polyprenyl-6-methoxyphenol hydroxylase-like FAD-dependent oxidoreductase
MGASAAADPACDVLIVGAGPVGLFLALQLVLRGRAVRLIEARGGQSEHSKALAIMPRTMEAFRAVGISGPFETAAFRVNGASILTTHAVLARVPIEPRGTKFDYLAMVPQDITERILLERLVAAGGRVEYGTEFLGLVDAPEGVTVRLATARGEERSVARYVVGCDGAHSSVRRSIGFEFEGGDYDATFVLADVDVVGDAPTGDMIVCPSALGPLAVFPISAKRCRLVAVAPKGFSGEPTLDTANEIIAARGPWNLGASKLHWASTFRIRHRQTPGMHKGAIFLAGDASHVHSPFGGQGMNTGLQDAFNLAWKLDFTLGGFGTRDLLPTYTVERHAVARNVIRWTDFATRALSSTNGLVRAIRDYAIPRVSENASFRRRFVETLTELGVQYGHSPIVEGKGLRAIDERIRAGDRERRLYDVLEGRYALVYPAAAPASVAAAFETFCEHYAGAVRALSSDEVAEPFVRLVRPDAYVALEASLTGDDPTPVIERLARVLATHVRRRGRAA